MRRRRRSEPLFTPDFLASDVRVDTDPAGAASSEGIRVAVDGLNVYCVWSDARDGGKDIYFNRSTDAGRSWLAGDLRLDTDAAGENTSEFVQIHASGPNVYVAWQDDRDRANDIRFSYSADQGTTFLARDLRCDTHPAGLADSMLPRLASDGTNVYVLWADRRDGQSDVYCRPSAR